MKVALLATVLGAIVADVNGKSSCVLDPKALLMLDSLCHLGGGRLPQRPD